MQFKEIFEHIESKKQVRRINWPKDVVFGLVKDNLIRSKNGVREGDITYEDMICDDWQVLNDVQSVNAITKAKFGFDEALRNLTNDKPVRLISWHSDEFIRLSPEHNTFVRRILQGYTPKTMDLLSMEWEIYHEDK